VVKDPLDLLHYEDTSLDRTKASEERLRRLENSELSGVAGPVGPQGPQGETGSPGPGSPSPLTQGDVLVVDGTPEITTLPIGNAHEILKVNAGGTDPGWEAFDWDEMSGVGGADMVHDHSSAAEGGATLNPTLVDLNGNADAIVLDADGDTSISAPTDDEIDVEVGGADVAEWKAGGLYYGAGIESFPNNDARGIATRFVNPSGLTAWTAHFRTGETTGPGNGTLASYSWQGAPLNGTPTIHSYTYAGDYLAAQASGAGNRHFLSTAISNVAGSWQNQSLYARVATGKGTEAGVRFDDGTDDNYVELYVDGLGDATYQLKFRYRDNAGGVTTVTSNLIVPVDRLVNIRLYSYYSGGNYEAYAYMVQETGLDINITGFNHILTGNWAAGPPAAGRAGLMIKDIANYGVFDWFYNTFT